MLKRFQLAAGAHLLAPISVRFSESEAEALTISALAAWELLTPTPFARPMASAHAKIKRTWLSEAFSFEPESESGVWDFSEPSSPSDVFNQAIFRALLTAVREKTVVEVSYYTASRRALSTSRELHPLGFLVRSQSWILTAFDAKSKQVKDFSLSGFRAALLLSGHFFESPPNFDLHRYARDRFRSLSGKTVRTIRIEVNPSAAPYFLRKIYHPTQQIDLTLPDGSLQVSFEVEGLDDLATFVRSWGPRVRVLEPTELLQIVAHDARETAELYAVDQREGGE